MSNKWRFLSQYGYAAAASLYLFTLGTRSPHHRALVRTISEHFGYPPRASSIPTERLADLAPDDVPVIVREADAVDGNVSLYELLAICKLVRSTRPLRLFEIGTFDGRTTVNLAANAPAEAHVFTLDLPRSGLEATALSLDRRERVFVDKDESGTRYRESDLAERITQLYGDSAQFDFSPHHGTADLVFVDGSHAFEYVLSDSRTALQLLKSGGGLVLWHDYGVWDGVTSALDRLFDGSRAFQEMRRIRGTSLVLLDTRR
jgi:predicted O-methyltransferase YrrM